ncbi:hypothetical protein QSV08_11755 [Maribacter sp. BPC-D8]|uniref:hypothetical protein n=1 Tax=Maribacter sp. BPC-D8 TaxID=3053613 RepID=UPI002B4769CA|nr:hypothetical protein [Maribacter sp. BPC-D8]WRI27898.1 hypothetical protein QSV08_11755 [Maribacter sp. BPC-D8]
MKKVLSLLVIICCLTATKLLGQRANLDREYFQVSYVDLPSIPILDDSKRTFTSSSRNIFLEGFSRVAQNGTLDFRFTFHGTEIGDVDIKKNKHEEKDKEGNVTKTTYTYDVICSYSSSATISINNSDSGENSSFTLSENDNYSSTGFKTYSKASSYYNNNRYSIRDKYRTKHRNSMISQTNSKINFKYGYVPKTLSQSQHFWIIATKKHPEFANHQEASESLKAIFSKMQHDQPVGDLLIEAQPWIDYFNDVVTRYNEDDKQHKKVRYASYYNIAKIYLNLDLPEKIKEYSDLLIANEYDKKDGKRLNNSAEDLINDFTINEISTRHFEVITEDLSNEPDVAIVYAEDPAEESEKAVAFLITAANDTLQTTVAIDELTKASAAIQMLDENNKAQEVAAIDSKQIVLTTGDIYEVATFTSSVASDKTNAPKFAKAIYQGSKVSLYEHMGKEYVLKYTNAEDGISTMSKDFVFGFNKKLAALSTECEAVKGKIMASEYKNTKEGLLAYSQAYDACAAE